MRERERVKDLKFNLKTKFHHASDTYPFQRWFEGFEAELREKLANFNYDEKDLLIKEILGE